MIVCPACSHRNPEGAKLCEACGRSLANFVYRVCPSCGALNSAQHVFCHRCFAELALAEGEEPIPESTFVRPYTPPIVTLEEEVTTQAVHREAKAQASETGARPTSEALPGQTPSEAELGPRAAAPISEEQAVAPSMEGEMGEMPASTEEALSPLEAAESPEVLGGGPVGAAGVETPAVQVAPPDETQALTPEAAANPLEGLDDLLPFEPAVTLPHRPSQHVSAAPSTTEDYEAELFQQVAVERAPLQEGAQVVLPRTAQGLPQIGRTILYILVLLAGVLPLFTWGQMSSFVQPRESVLALVRTIEELPSGAEVLLSFDYSPTYAGELDPLALAVVRHLARRSVRMVVMSTKPEGIGLAEAIYRTITEESPDYRYGEHYVLLGYLPGQEAGLRSLNTALGDAFKIDYLQKRPLGELSATSGLATLKDFDQIIVLSDDSLTVQRWVEQVQAQSDIPFHALVTSAVEPLLVPYQRSGQLLSLIPAASGAVEYELAGSVKPSALFRSDAYAAFFVLLLVVALVTNALYARRGKRGS